MNCATARERFCDLVGLPEAELPLAEAALCISWEDQGVCDCEAALQHLDALAGAVRLRIEDVTRPYQVIAEMNDYLFGELGFQGNHNDYGNPANSFLDQVLERRIGLPIVLSVIYMEVGWRLGLPISGVALPGHFIARYTTCNEEIFVDPFNGGRLWSWSECRQQVLSAYGQATPTIMQQVMLPPSKHEILSRILRNLKHTYFVTQDFQHALSAVERIILLNNDDIHEIRDRGLLGIRLGAILAGMEDLERYARVMPHALDLPELQQYASMVIGPLAAKN